MIPITPTIALAEEDIELRFVRAAGPGGQNVNKVATAVQLRFDVDGCRALAAEVKARLLRLAGQRATLGNVILIQARRFRTQERNRDDAVARLRELILAALVEPKRRKRTRPPASAVRQRLHAKQRQARRKQRRGRVSAEE